MASMSNPIFESDSESQQFALTLCQIAVEQIVSGQVDQAVESLEESLRLFPTAEGYTYRGWAFALQGHHNKAISYCRKAIRLDPLFGNPYNDIGVYLMQLGRFEEALQWFERAKKASRYDPRHYPYLNSGHIYMIFGEQNKALAEYVVALELDPGNEIAHKAMAQMEMDFF